MRNKQPKFLHNDQTECEANVYRSTLLMLTRDLFAVANLLVIKLQSCLVLQNNQQSSSWSITLMVVVTGGSWHANRRTSGQLSFEGSWILLLNNNRKLVPITDCSDSK